MNALRYILISIAFMSIFGCTDHVSRGFVIMEHNSKYYVAISDNFNDQPAAISKDFDRPEDATHLLDALNKTMEGNWVNSKQ